MELAAAPIQALTERVFDVGAKNIEYATDLKAEFARLRQYLEHVNGLLNDKENLKLREAHVKPVLIPLRELIYEADDVIADCILKDEYSGGGVFFGLLQKCDLKFSLQTGKQLKEINRRLAEQLATLKEFLELKEMLKADKDEPKNDEGVASQWFNPDVVIGIDGDIEKIKNWICEENKNELHRVAVSGMGGLGKTTVVQKIYGHGEVSKYFDTKIWVRVSKNFSKSEILRSILAVLVGGSRLSNLRSGDYLGEIRRAVERRKGCLVVMDDVWRIDDVNWWSTLCSTFDVPNKRNCIIVTTRDENVAKLSVRGDDERIHRPRPLSDEESWRLFSRFAFSTDKPEFKEVGEKIVGKCGRLPLSIKTMGALLATKDTLSEWSEVLNSFHGSDKITGNDQVIETLRVSYNELDSHLKLCMLSFSIYPEDAEISAEQVIHWWVSEGLLQKRESKKSMVDLGHEYLSELTGRCLVEVRKCRPYDGRVYSCRIHDMLREMVMKIAEEEGFCSFNEQGIMNWKDKDPYWMCLTLDVIKERESTRSQDESTISKCLFEKNSRIRALLLMTNRQIELNKSSGVLASLRMLDLSGGSINQLDQKRLKDLLDWIGALTRLACLNLSELTSLEELPSSICELRNLQLLVLRGCCNLKKLPEKIGKLKKLVVLHLGNSSHLNSLPQSLGKLSNLQELNGARVTVGRGKSKAQNFGLSELRNLKQLRVLQVVISSDNEAEISDDTEEWNKIFSGLTRLKTLDLDTDNFSNGSIMIDRLTPPESLKELYLRNYHRGKLPQWIDPSKLKELQYLCIEEAQFVGEWVVPRNAKWRVLEGLRLKDMKSLNVDWAVMKEAVKALRYLEVIDCSRVKNLPADMAGNVWRSGKKRA